jgi:hypothetical protein
MEGTAYGKERVVELRTGGVTLFTGRLPAGGVFAPVSTGPVDWAEGLTEVKIIASEPGTSPESLDPNVRDDRLLSAGFRRVHLERNR